MPELSLSHEPWKYYRVGDAGSVSAEQAVEHGATPLADADISFQL